MPRWAGWKSLQDNEFLKAPPRYQQLTRGFCNYIGDDLVKIREFGVKVRFWTLFWQGTNVSALCISRCKRNRTMKCKGIYHTWQDLGAFIAMSSTIKSEYWLALWPKVFYKSRERIKISAFAAHHGPNPAFLTIILDKACLGSMLKGSQHSGGGQKACFQGFQKCTILAQETGHTETQAQTSALHAQWPIRNTYSI